MNSPLPESNPDRIAFDEAFAACIARPCGPVGPTGQPDVAFAVRLLGASDHHTAADCATPHGSANPGWLMPLVDLLLARGALGPGSATSCVTMRMDLNVNAAALAATTTVRGLARQAFADPSSTAGTCELRGDDGTVVATGMGVFVSIDTPLPDPFEATAGHEVSSALTELLPLTFDDSRHRADWRIEPWMANPSGVVHGGVQAAALFAAIEEAGTADLDGPVAFGNVSVEYLRPLPVADTVLTIRVTARRRGRRFATYDAELLTADGTVGTTATATVRPTAD